MKIILATDHAGFELKEKIKHNLINRGYSIKDFGSCIFSIIEKEKKDEDGFLYISYASENTFG